MGELETYKEPASIAVWAAGIGNPVDGYSEANSIYYLHLTINLLEPIILEPFPSDIRNLRIRAYTEEPTDDMLFEIGRKDYHVPDWIPYYDSYLFDDRDPTDGFWFTLRMIEDLSGLSELWIAIDTVGGPISEKIISETYVWRVPLFDATEPPGSSSMCRFYNCVYPDSIIWPSYTKFAQPANGDAAIVEICLDETAAGVTVDRVEFIDTHPMHRVVGIVRKGGQGEGGKRLFTFLNFAPGDLYPEYSEYIFHGYITPAGDYQIIHTKALLIFGDRGEYTMIYNDWQALPHAFKEDQVHFYTLAYKSNTPTGIGIKDTFVMLSPGGPIWRTSCSHDLPAVEPQIPQGESLPPQDLSTQPGQIFPVTATVRTAISIVDPAEKLEIVPIYQCPGGCRWLGDFGRDANLQILTISLNGKYCLAAGATVQGWLARGWVTCARLQIESEVAFMDNVFPGTVQFPMDGGRTPVIDLLNGSQNDPFTNPLTLGTPASIEYWNAELEITPLDFEVIPGQPYASVYNVETGQYQQAPAKIDYQFEVYRGQLLNTREDALFIPAYTSAVLLKVRITGKTANNCTKEYDFFLAREFGLTMSQVPLSIVNLGDQYPMHIHYLCQDAEGWMIFYVEGLGELEDLWFFVVQGKKESIWHLQK